MHVLNRINLQLYFNCSSHNSKSKAENRVKNIILRHVNMPISFFFCRYWISNLVTSLYDLVVKWGFGVGLGETLLHKVLGLQWNKPKKIKNKIIMLNNLKNKPITQLSIIVMIKRISMLQPRNRVFNVKSRIRCRLLILKLMINACEKLLP